MDRRLLGLVWLLFGVSVASAQTDPPGWAAHVISTDTDRPFAVWPADIDGDGDQDVFSAGLHDKIVWHENVDGVGATWIDHFIDTAASAYSIYAVDVNGDAAVDLLVGGLSGTEPLIWYDNQSGDGSSWIRNPISFGQFNARDVHAGDIDSDGDMDFLSALENGDRVMFTKNLDGLGTSWTWETVGTGNIPISVDAADMDDDGTLDVLTIYSAETRVAWYANKLGDGSSWVEHDILEIPGIGGHSVSPGDIDGDGDLDALSASFSDDLTFNRNEDGMATRWSAIDIPTVVGKFISVYAADLDLDGDLDAVTSSFAVDMTDTWVVAGQENLLGDGSAWMEFPISTAPAKGRAAVVGDIDGDCDLDALAATSTNDSVTWIENLGPDADCNGNGISDACDIASGGSNDCNGNGIPDECDLANGTSGDELSFGFGHVHGKPAPTPTPAGPWIGGGNGILDECEYPGLSQVLEVVPEDRATAVRPAGHAAEEGTLGVVAADEPLQIQVEGSGGAGEALVYVSYSGPIDAVGHRMVGGELVAARKVTLDVRGRSWATLPLEHLPPGAGSGGFLSVRAVFLAEDGRPLRSSESLEFLLVDAPEAAISR